MSYKFQCQLSSFVSILRIVTVFLICSFSSYSIAAKVGVVDIGKVLQNSSLSKSKFTSLESQVKTKQVQLQSLFEQFKKTQVNYEKNRLTMSEKQKEQTEEKLREMQKKLTRRDKDLKEWAKLEEAKIMRTMQDKINNVIQQIAKAEKFDLIIYQGVAYASDSINITNKVVKKLK